MRTENKPPLGYQDKLSGELENGTPQRHCSHLRTAKVHAGGNMLPLSSRQESINKVVRTQAEDIKPL